VYDGVLVQLDYIFAYIRYRQISLASSATIWYVRLIVGIFRYTVYIADRRLSRISTTIGAMGLFLRRCLNTTSDLASGFFIVVSNMSGTCIQIWVCVKLVI
jgi:hypothetical protein